MEYPETTRYWLWLEMVFGPANAKKMELVRTSDSVKELYYVLHDPNCSLLNEKERRSVRKSTLSQCEGVIEYCNKNNIGIITWDDALYPETLRNIHNPPSVLFYKGDPILLHQGVLLTVVGTRRPSDYSRRVTKWLCTDLARANLVLVSGCAVGLDACAHHAAMDAGKPTIAVLGCGVDYDYPKENRAMKDKIVENGLLLSEYFPGTPPYAQHFPVRNRILSGVSQAVLVVEASARSGALITANLACEQERYVFCVPPADLFDPRYGGVADFLRDGAYPVFNYLDILYVYYMKYPHKITLFDEKQVTRTSDSLLFYGERLHELNAMKNSEAEKQEDAQEQKAVQETADPQKKQETSELNPIQRKILDTLKKGGQNINAICLMTGLSFEEVSVQMVDMEMMGYVHNTERDVFVLADDPQAQPDK